MHGGSASNAGRGRVSERRRREILSGALGPGATLSLLLATGGACLAAAGCGDGRESSTGGAGGSTTSISTGGTGGGAGSGGGEPGTLCRGKQVPVSDLTIGDDGRTWRLVSPTGEVDDSLSWWFVAPVRSDGA